MTDTIADPYIKVNIRASNIKEYFQRGFKVFNLLGAEGINLEDVEVTTEEFKTDFYLTFPYHNTTKENTAIDKLSKLEYITYTKKE
jgi:hypothetical protein